MWGILYNLAAKYATVAQLVEQTIRNRQVKGSTPFGGSHKTSGKPDVLFFKGLGWE
jgi:hypothetical protein